MSPISFCYHYWALTRNGSMVQPCAKPTQKWDWVFFSLQTCLIPGTPGLFGVECGRISKLPAAPPTKRSSPLSLWFWRRGPRTHEYRVSLRYCLCHLWGKQLIQQSIVMENTCREKAKEAAACAGLAGAWTPKRHVYHDHDVPCPLGNMPSTCARSSISIYVIPTSDQVISI